MELERQKVAFNGFTLFSATYLIILNCYEKANWDHYTTSQKYHILLIMLLSEM